MVKIVFCVLICFSSHVFSEHVYYCSGQATMCVRKNNNIWIADVCDSGKFIFTFNKNYSELKYKKKVRTKTGKDIKITELLKCKKVPNVSTKNNNKFLSTSNGRITCIDFDGSQIGIPEVVEEVIHFSKNKDRFSIYPMHSHSYIMNGSQIDFVTFGTCSKYD